MRRFLITAPLTAALMMCSTLLHAAAPSIANDALLHSARMWEARDRGDLALLALQKLVAARPDSPDALQELGELALRMNDITTATSVLTQLTTRFANSKPAHAFALAYRLATRDRLQLASLQRLVQIGEYTKARAEFKRLFPSAPSGHLSLQYYQLLSELPGTWQPVHDQLKALSQRNPDESRYRLALARHLLRRDSTRLQGVQMLHELRRRDDLRSSEVDGALITALKSLGSKRAPANVVRAYVQRNPQDADAARLAASINTDQRDTQRWRRDALNLLASQFNTDDDAQVQAELTRLREQDEHLVAALDHLFELDHSSPRKHAAVADWYTQGRTALAQGRTAEADLNLRIALALQQREYEDTIALAEQLEAAGRTADSGALLHTATQLAPDSSWLFESRIRWLVNNGQAHTALLLLADKPLDKRYLATTRDTLRATALKQRAADTATSAPQQSLNDLHTALTLTPDDAWLRYQLATRYAQAGDPQRGRALMAEGAARKHNDVEMSYAQALYLSGIDDPHGALASLQAIDTQHRTDNIHALQARLTQTLARRDVDALLAQQRIAEAALLLDQLIAAQPADRGLRIWRAELDQQLQQPQAARDRLAVLVAEQPDDLETRLDYVRALHNSGDTELARLQLQAVQQRAARDDARLRDTRLQLAIARRAWSLDDAATTAQTLRPILAQLPDSDEAWLLAGRSELALRNFATARERLLHAEQLSDSETSATARALRESIDARLQATLTSGIQSRRKPGDDGVSSFDSLTLLNAWEIPINYEQRLTLRADTVTLDAGRLPANSDTLFGSNYLDTSQTHVNKTQRGVSVGVIHHTDTTTADIGVTPLGFLLPNVVGGFAWQPAFKPLDITIGIERRAVTSSVLSYAGMRDPASGIKWGGVTTTGAYLQAGRYRADYSLSGSLRAMQLSGTKVPDNRFIGARLAGDWRWLARTRDQSWLGLAVSYWNYQHNLQNYTLGSGGYYSPKSYVSVALPFEWQGQRDAWSYHLRASVAYSASQTQRAAYFPQNTPLQQQAEVQAQLTGDAEPYFQASRGSGVSLAASARVEYQLSQRFVLGGQAATDRADYYRPVELSLYVRHNFGSATKVALPPRPLRPYND